MTDDTTQTFEIDGHDIEVGNADKVLFPDAGLTKSDLADYWVRIGPTAIAHYRDRALTMHRFPDGIGEEGFFQKEAGDYFPDWIQRRTLPKENGEVTHVIADSTAALVYLVDQACITPHLSLFRIDKPKHPDRMIFDLDPSDHDFAKVQETASHIHRALDDLDLPSFVQTTGSRGLHIVVPLDRSSGFDTVREFTHGLCRFVAAEDPDLMTVEQRKKRRGDRVFLDDLRNAYGQTAVAPYAVRAHSGAPVATPLRWDEVGDGDLHPQRYTVDNLFRRMAQIEDPWKNIADAAIALPDRKHWPDAD